MFHRTLALKIVSNLQIRTALPWISSIVDLRSIIHTDEDAALLLQQGSALDRLQQLLYSTPLAQNEEVKSTVDAPAAAATGSAK
jgi:hypothetical protein